MSAQPEKKTTAKATQWILLCLIAFCLSAGIRLLDAPAWQAPQLSLGSEKLFARYDAYAWLAGAEGVNEFSGHPFARALRLTSRVTGLSVATIGFWLPALVAPLVVFPVCLLTMWWGVPRSGIAASVIASAAFGYLGRTRLGCLDSDIYTLLFPVLGAVGLVLWLEPNLRQPWKRGRSWSASELILGAAALGLLLHLYWQFYPPGRSIGLAVWGVGLLVAVLFGAPGRRLLMAAAMMLMLVVWGTVIAGLLVSGLALVLVRTRPGLITTPKILVAWIVVLTCWLGLGGQLQELRSQIGAQVVRYATRAAPAETAATPVLPDTVTTLGEAKRIPLTLAVRLMAGHWVLFVLGISGLVNLLWRRPSGLVLLPLLALGVASMQLGYRFAMYGGAVIGIGLCVGWALALMDMKAPPWIRLSVQLVLLILIVGLSTRDLRNNPPASFLTPGYAQALSELGGIAAPGAQVWPWWDFGYAAQHFSRRMTFADGRRNTAAYVLPLASIFATRHPEHAYRIMVYTAREQEAAGGESNRSRAPTVAASPFSSLIREGTPREAQLRLEAIRHTPQEDTGGLPEQYMVVSWDNLPIAPLLASFGTWNIVDGESRSAGIVALLGGSPVDLDRGAVYLGSKRHLMRTLDVITSQGRKNRAWPENATGMHVIHNEITGVVLAMDQDMYASMMVQMLIADPEDFAPHFDLAVDRAPFARIYRLNPGADPLLDL